MSLTENSLFYHKNPNPGKIAILPTKPCSTQEELSLAYTPGVAQPCLEIEKDKNKVFDYTSKGNLVGVITDGSAVLGLGNIGALASKPVMEGKSVLFKKFSGIDAFDIEINEQNPDKFVEIVKSISPTFGGINLEDISSPRCFIIEEKLKNALDIPVFHDDQHGTAVIAGAAVLNAIELTNKKKENMKIVISGAGAAGRAIFLHLINLGFSQEQIFVYDKFGVLFKGRKEIISDWHKMLFRETSSRTLSDLMKGADVFIGVSVGGIVSKEMIDLMNENPVIFAMANPVPEISYEDVKSINPNAIVGTGRSDFPNQVNNVLGFPAIFRGALDVRAKSITENMKKAASIALANVAKMKVPKDILKAYNLQHLEFSNDYVIPKPFDKRVLIEVAYAVAKSAVKDNVAKKEINFDIYKDTLGEII
jgi:malate dehydrogenase (oxaloacetate-decarboxylating)(NADP+)